MRRIRIFSGFILFIGLVSCSNKEKIPGNVLSQEKMKSVLQDMMKADQFISDYVLNRDTSKKRETESIKLYNHVFAIHGVSPEKFFTSLNFYQRHPAFLRSIWDSISKQIETPLPSITPVLEEDTATIIKPINLPAKNSKAKQ